MMWRCRSWNRKSCGVARLFSGRSVHSSTCDVTMSARCGDESSMWRSMVVLPVPLVPSMIVSFAVLIIFL